MNTKTKLNYIDPSSIRLWHPAPGARPRAEIDGDRCILQTRLYRCFPLSTPEKYVSVQDAGGHEVGILHSLVGLDPESLRVVESELDRRYFTPVIEQIVSLKAEASMWRWDVKTQRGQISFYLRGVRDAIHEVAPRRWQVTSMDGQRYEIRDFEKLDARSQSLFEGLF